MLQSPIEPCRNSWGSRVLPSSIEPRRDTRGKPTLYKLRAVKSVGTCMELCFVDGGEEPALRPAEPRNIILGIQKSSEGTSQKFFSTHKGFTLKIREKKGDPTGDKVKGGFFYT